MTKPFESTVLRIPSGSPRQQCARLLSRAKYIIQKFFYFYFGQVRFAQLSPQDGVFAFLRDW